VTLTEFLLARIAEDEWWAREASRRDEAYVETGVHWRWEFNDTDVVATIDPLASEWLGLDDEANGFKMSLRSVEEFPTATVGPLPQFAIGYAEEVPTTIAGHIARHDPARVLAECEAKRRIVERHADETPYCSSGAWEDTTHAEMSGVVCPTLALLASVYADHPDYQELWREPEHQLEVQWRSMAGGEWHDAAVEPIPSREAVEVRQRIISEEWRP